MRRAIIATAGVAALLIGTGVIADPAAAHHATLTVEEVCQDDGSWTASWEITNSESGKVMDILDEDVTNLSPNPTPKSGSSTDVTTHDNDVLSVTAHVTVDWTEHQALSYEATATKPEGCVPPPPPVCEYDPNLPADDPGCVPPPPPPIDTCEGEHADDPVCVGEPPVTPPVEESPPATPTPATPKFTG